MNPPASKDQDPYILSILVKNEPGVLTKVAQLFYRRGYNIETLTVGKTQEPGLSKIVILVPLNERDVEYLRRQIENLVDVLHAQLLDRRQCIQTEVCLIRLGYTTEDDRHQIMSLAQPYRPRLRDIDGKSMVLRVAANPELIDEFVLTMIRHEVPVLDVSRTGMTALGPTLSLLLDEEEQPGTHAQPQPQPTPDRQPEGG